MKTDWVLSRKAFDAFLAWLDPDRDRAGEKYEGIRGELIRDFVRRVCTDPEAFADQAIDRVIRDLPEIARTHFGDPASYIYTVAQELPHRFWRKVSEARSLPVANEPTTQNGVTDAWSYAKSILVLKSASWA
jgi:hypothetical protein